MHTAYLLVGSNIEPEENIRRALALLREQDHIVKLSSVWKTRAEGSSGPDFLNLALCLKTEQDYYGLKWQRLRPLEAQLGRVRTSDKNAPRTIDLDIIVFDGQVMDEKLWEQFFVALPMAELLPDLVNRMSGKTLREVAEGLSREGLAKVLEGMSF